MTDTATIERYMRDANPIPHVDDVDAEEFTRFVAAANTRMAAARRATTQNRITPSTTTRSQGRRSKSAWALTAGFVLVLLVLSAAALFLRGDDTPVAEEPAPSPAVTTPEEATTTAADDRELVGVVAGWQPIDNPWLVRDETSIEALPNGGFVAASRLEHPDGSYVMWSPDGLNWFDGDPQRLLPRQGREVPQQGRELVWQPGLAVVGHDVIILTDDITPGGSAPTLWIGNPKAGTWEPIMALDTTGLAGQLLPGLITVSAGTDEALVAALTTPWLPPDGSAPDKIGAVVVWLVDPMLATATRTNLPIATTGPYAGAWPIAWFDQRWHVMLPLRLVDYYWVETALWSSADGTLWTEDEFPDGWRMPMLNALVPTTGPSGMVVFGNTDGAEGAWFSPNGVDWHWLGPISNGRGVYSDGLGFVLEGAEDLSEAAEAFYRLSPDGEALRVLASPFPADTVAASGNNLIVHAYRGSEYGGGESTGIEGAWLYHHPDDG